MEFETIYASAAAVGVCTLVAASPLQAITTAITGGLPKTAKSEATTHCLPDGVLPQRLIVPSLPRLDILNLTPASIPARIRL